MKYTLYYIVLLLITFRPLEGCAQQADDIVRGFRTRLERLVRMYGGTGWMETSAKRASAKTCCG